MSIVRVGLAENQQLAENYDAIFGNKKKSAAKTAKPKPAKAKAAAASAKVSNSKTKKKTPSKKK